MWKAGGLTSSPAQCHRKWMVVVCAVLLLAPEHLLREIPDMVDSGLSRFRHRLTGNAAYQLRRQTTSGWSQKFRQHRW